MTKLMPLALALALIACGKAPPTDTVETLAANPVRLRELRKQCKTNREEMGDALCNRVAEATNRRFFSDSKVPYTPSEEQPKF